MEEVKIVNLSKNPLPEYATSGSAGVDLRASLEKSVVLKSFERKLITTDYSIQLPQGYEAQIRPRSGLAFKSGITVLNTPGTIDSDYTGVIKVILINLSNSDFVINNGDRVAQMVISKYEKVSFKPVESLDETERGEGGFGHTGKN